MLYSKGKLKGIKEYTIKSFVFCYNNYYPTHQEAKYGVNYQPQEPKLDVLKSTEEADLLQEIDQDPMATFNKVLVKIILQKYARAAGNIKKEILVAAYQGLENY